MDKHVWQQGPTRLKWIPTWWKCTDLWGKAWPLILQIHVESDTEMWFQSTNLLSQRQYFFKSSGEDYITELPQKVLVIGFSITVLLQATIRKASVQGQSLICPTCPYYFATPRHKTGTSTCMEHSKSLLNSTFPVSWQATDKCQKYFPLLSLFLCFPPLSLSPSLQGHIYSSPPSLYVLGHSLWLLLYNDMSLLICVPAFVLAWLTAILPSVGVTLSSG